MAVSPVSSRCPLDVFGVFSTSLGTLVRSTICGTVTALCTLVVVYRLMCTVVQCRQMLLLLIKEATSRRDPPAPAGGRDEPRAFRAARRLRHQRRD